MWKDRAGRSSAAAGTTHTSETQKLHHIHTLLRYTQDVWPGVSYSL